MLLLTRIGNKTLSNEKKHILTDFSVRTKFAGALE